MEYKERPHREGYLTMTKLRLAYSKNGRYVPAPTRKKSAPPSIVLPTLQLLSWKIEQLQAVRPAAVHVVEDLVDDMLERARKGSR